MTKPIYCKDMDFYETLWFMKRNLKKQSETFVCFHEIDEVFVYDSISMLEESV